MSNGEVDLEFLSSCGLVTDGMTDDQQVKALVEEIKLKAAYIRDSSKEFAEGRETLGEYLKDVKHDLNRLNQAVQTLDDLANNPQKGEVLSRAGIKRRDRVNRMEQKVLFSRMTIVEAVDEEKARDNLARLAGSCIFAGNLKTEVKEGVPLTFKWSVEPYKDPFISVVSEENVSEENQTEKIRISLEVWREES